MRGNFRRNLILFISIVLSLIMLSMIKVESQPQYNNYFNRASSVLQVSEATYNTASEASTPYLKQHPEFAEELVLRAFIKGGIYYAEGIYPNARNLNPYDVIVGYSTIQDHGKDYSDHPRVDIWIDSINDSSDAAGACQFISSTWDLLQNAYPDIWYTDVPAFHPKNQDLACLINFVRTGGYKSLVKGISVSDAGRISVDVEAFTAAVHDACVEWASFPGPDGRGCIGGGKQRTEPIENLWKNFQKTLDELQAGFVPNWNSELIVESNKPPSTPEELFRPELRTPLKDGEQVEGCFYGENKEPCFVTDTVRIRDKHPVFGDRRWHRGFDIGMTVGTPLYAPIYGKVSCHMDDDAIFGIYAIFESPEFPGRYWLLHHLDACVADVGQSAQVERGQVIGKSGTAGTGPHLHLEGWRLVDGKWEFFEYAKGWATAFAIGDIPK